MDNLDDILLNAEDKMAKSFTFMQDQMLGLRTGKASPALVENIKAAVSYTHLTLPTNREV